MKLKIGNEVYLQKYEIVLIDYRKGKIKFVFPSKKKLNFFARLFGCRAQ